MKKRKGKKRNQATRIGKAVLLLAAAVSFLHRKGQNS